MLNVDLTLPKLNQLWVRLISSSILASLGVLSGLTPEIAINNSSEVNSSIIITLANNAYGQQFTPAETESYAKAGYEVELLRRKVYQEIKNLIKEPPPNILCDQQSTIDILQSEIRNIANRYCTQSRQIVQRHSLSVNRFNELKTYYDRQDTFYDQVQRVLLKLQR
jgi:hypothetical protein